MSELETESNGSCCIFKLHMLVHSRSKIFRGEEESRAKLAVINIGDTFAAGPTEAAFVINELVQPNAVIPSHARKWQLKKGKVISGTKTDTFAATTKCPPIVR